MTEQIGAASLVWHGAAVEIDVPPGAFEAVLGALRGAGLTVAASLRPAGGGTLRTRLAGGGVAADGLRALVRAAQGTSGRTWAEIRGAVEHPLCAADAQEAVRRGREDRAEGGADAPGGPPRPAKGHWRKGRSRNLDPEMVQVARRVELLLASALRRGWRHPSLGVLSTRVVGAHLGVEHSTVARWAKGTRLPPLEMLERLAELLREYRP